MLGYVTIGASDFEKARDFYDSLIAEIGGTRVFESPTGQFYGFGEGNSGFYGSYVRDSDGNKICIYHM